MATPSSALLPQQFRSTSEPPSTNVSAERPLQNMATIPGNQQLVSYPDPPRTGADEDATGPASPTLPTVSNLDQVTGYEDVDFQGGSYIPPPADVQAANQSSEQQSDNMQPNFPTISENEARNALYEEVTDHCCYGTGAVENLVILGIQSSSAFHYELETFTEGRTTNWAYEPYKGQEIDGPQNGQAPGAWNILAEPDQLFLDHEKHYEVPHTASVKTCTNCDGEGVNRCWRCLGSGIVVCGHCGGNGAHVMVVNHTVHSNDPNQCHNHSDVQVVPCVACNCTGKVRCHTCLGCGLLKCDVCKTHGQLKVYIKLTVTWTTHLSDHVVERTALPDELICNAEGRVAFQEQHQRVAPVAIFPDQAVNDASYQLVQSHSVSFPTQRILMQRHWIRVVPVSEVLSDFKGKRFTYWVYGHDNLVFNPDYPQKCCWGCTVL